MLAPHRRFALRFLASLLAALIATAITGWSDHSSSGGQLQPVAQGPGGMEIRSSDRISIIGNTLADRMQHDGWLETYIHSRFPLHDLVFRNLGFSADELNLRCGCARRTSVAPTRG